VCPSCGQRANGKPSLAITCTPCGIPMPAVGAATNPQRDAAQSPDEAVIYRRGIGSRDGCRAANRTVQADILFTDGVSDLGSTSENPGLESRAHARVHVWRVLKTECAARMQDDRRHRDCLDDVTDAAVEYPARDAVNPGPLLRGYLRPARKLADPN